MKYIFVFCILLGGCAIGADPILTKDTKTDTSGDYPSEANGSYQSPNCLPPMTFIQIINGREVSTTIHFPCGGGSLTTGPQSDPPNWGNPDHDDSPPNTEGWKPPVFDPSVGPHAKGIR